MIADKVITNIYRQKIDKKIVKIPFEWFELDKKRISKTAEDGTEFGIAIDATKQDGDVLAETEEKVFVISVLPAHLIKVTVSTMQEMGRLGFELGNRHLSLQINEHEVRVPYDAPTFEYLCKLGFHAEETTEQFTHFIVCKAHGAGHDHGEEHIHNHSHHDH